jgi:hypothetical protein
VERGSYIYLSWYLAWHLLYSVDRWRWLDNGKRSRGGMNNSNEGVPEVWLTRHEGFKLVRVREIRYMNRVLIMGPEDRYYDKLLCGKAEHCMHVRLLARA